MIIEPLDAANGDSAIVRHTGRAGDTVLGLIDGGPSSTLRRSIAPALEAHGIVPEANSSLDWLCVSHVDSDHIGGVLSLVRVGYTVGRFLYNTPSPFPDQDVTPATGTARASQREAELTRLVSSAEENEVLPASYRQGQDLLDLLVVRGLHRLNPPRNQRLLTGDTLDVDGLTIQVVAPSATRIEALLAEWSEAVDGASPASAEKMDTSITNLSSLSLLLVEGDRKALFTGDSLEDDILAGLRALGQQLPMHVDVLKVPHHGSNSAANPDALEAGEGLLENVMADFYIVSADGTSTNPTPATLERIVNGQDSGCVIVLPSATQAGDGSHEYYAQTVADLVDLASAAPVPIEVRVGGPNVIDLS